MRPVELARGDITLRALKRSDEAAWHALRSRNRAWLRPWEATLPPGRREPQLTFAGLVRRERRQWRDDAGYPFVITSNGDLVGRVAVAGIRWGAECGASIGYWIDEAHAGRGMTPTAVALATEHCFAAGLHRVEVAVRPENAASVRVAEKLGFVEEGLRRSYLYIDGDWRDHRVFVRTQGMARIGRYWDSGH
ncbi:GNAT family N-acetyltransferase [Demequina sp. NBRC 110055]|uniref:GNAT family N-acetyltransferase n=1 Tax=Demequina sp. NBRC 110055 TaxID=1570344 RepID=UPI000A03A766|nr:GNAT family protein [Demequina sp. NBRC 110055]